MKKSILILVSLLAFALAGCSSESKTPTAEKSATTAPADETPTAPKSVATVEDVPTPVPVAMEEAAPPEIAADTGKTYKVVWSHYTGWEPWGYIVSSGIMDKWAAKYGIKVEIDLISSYVNSINMYTSGSYDACVMTNMDALAMPAVGGVDSTVLIIGDSSNGNDGIAVRGIPNVAGLRGADILLQELTVSHYLLSRALQMEGNGLTENDMTLTNMTDESQIPAVFIEDSSKTAITWNPLLMTIRQEPGVEVIFESSQIPGEILDLMVIRTDAPTALKKALTGAWYEAMSQMSAKGRIRDEALNALAEQAGGTLSEFKQQLKTTAMMYQPAQAVAFAFNPSLVDTMEFIRTFLFNKGLYGTASSKDYVGISFPDGTVIGDSGNVKLRFTSYFMKLAADGKLE